MHRWGIDLSLGEAADLAGIIGTIVAALSFYLQFGKTRAPGESNPSEGHVRESEQPDRTPGTSGGSMGRTRSQGLPKRAAMSLVPGIIAGVIVYAIAYAISVGGPSKSAPIAGSSVRQSITPTQSNSPTASAAASAMAPTNGPVVHFLSVVPETAISESNGFTVKGSYSGLGNDTIWLTDYDGGYTVDNEATLATNGTWTVSDSPPLGNQGQALPFPLTVRVILADTHCAAALQATYNTNGDYLTTLPGGCIVADALTVSVTKS
jgi:hypothetical protein